MLFDGVILNISMNLKIVWINNTINLKPQRTTVETCWLGLWGMYVSNTHIPSSIDMISCHGRTTTMDGEASDRAGR